MKDKLDRLRRAREVKGCPWELEDFSHNTGPVFHAPMINWSNDCWDVARDYLDALEALKPIADWYGVDGGDEGVPRKLSEVLKDVVADLQADRARVIELEPRKPQESTLKIDDGRVSVRRDDEWVPVGKFEQVDGAEFVFSLWDSDSHLTATECRTISDHLAGLANILKDALKST